MIPKYRVWITYGYTEEDLKNPDMTDEIKETGLGFMDTPDLIDFRNDEIRVKYDCDWYDSDRFTLMQSTGFKDKNGREIFEGDIVVECWSEGQMAIGEVRRRIDGWWFIYPSWKNGMTWGLCPNYKGETTVKIVGNIYENPELLSPKR